MSDWLIDHGKQGLRLAKREGPRVTLFDCDFVPKQQGSIYEGRVVDVLKNAQMAFVDIGLGTNGVLPLKERQFPPLTRGDTVLCQVTREADPQENKGPQLSRNITLAIGPVLFTPFVPGLNLSKKLKAPELVQQLQMAEGEGVVLRQHAYKYDGPTLNAILEKLRQDWNTLKSQSGAAPYCLREAPSLLERVVAHIEPGDTIETNHKPTAQTLTALLLASYGGGPEIEVTRDSPFDDNIQDQWGFLTAARVPVPGGGELIIEETAALVAVDVNNGGASSTPHDLNKKALRELFHQIQLRNLAGIIMVDLAGTLKHPKQMLQSARALADSSTHVHGITDLGLLEISRKKSGPSLTQVLKNN